MRTEKKVKLSPFQQRVVDMLKGEHSQLSNSYEGEGSPYRPDNGMCSGMLHENIYASSYTRRWKTVPYKTIAALLKLGVIEESHRNTHTAYYGTTPFETATIYYKLKGE